MSEGRTRLTPLTQPVNNDFIFSLINVLVEDFNERYDLNPPVEEPVVEETPVEEETSTEDETSTEEETSTEDESVETDEGAEDKTTDDSEEE